MSMTLEEALEYIYKVVKCREQDKAKCNGCESCSYNFKFGWTYKAEKAIAQYYEERHRQSEQTPAQPEIIRCKDCIFYDPPHVENEGVRIEYKDLPKEAFDVLGTGLVSAEYGINVGGRCCVDYYCKNYPDDKRVYVPKDNYCGRAERRTDANNNLHV